MLSVGGEGGQGACVDGIEGDADGGIVRETAHFKVEGWAASGDRFLEVTKYIFASACA